MKAYIFIFINVLIIAATELTGKLFVNSGAIHAIALVFVVAAAVPLARNYYLADPIFKKFLTASIFAFILFSVSHISEYALFSMHAEYQDHIFAIAVNFYLASVLLMLIGAEIFLRAYSGYRSSKIPFAAAGILIVMLISFSFFLSIYPKTVSFEPDNSTPYFYAAMSMAVALLFWKRLSQLKKAIQKSLAGFFNFLGVMLIFVMVSLLLYIFYEFIEEFAKIPEYQVIYLSHFFFYIGLSIMFLSFEELLNIGGVIKDIREFKKNQNNKIKGI